MTNISSGKNMKPLFCDSCQANTWIPVCKLLAMNPKDATAGIAVKEVIEWKCGRCGKVEAIAK